MQEVGTIYQIDNGFLLKVPHGDSAADSMIYCKDHKAIADTIISKRVSELMKSGPVQQELPFTYPPNDSVNANFLKGA